MALTVRGKNFTDVAGVQFDPPTGLTPVPPFVVTEGNTVLSFAVQVGASAPTGTRTVIVNTAGGPSGVVPAPANTVQVAQQVGRLPASWRLMSASRWDPHRRRRRLTPSVFTRPWLAWCLAAPMAPGPIISWLVRWLWA